MDKYPNVYMDMTPGGEMFPNFELDSEKWRNFFVKYHKRILLSSLVFVLETILKIGKGENF